MAHGGVLVPEEVLPISCSVMVSTLRLITYGTSGADHVQRVGIIFYFVITLATIANILTFFVRLALRTHNQLLNVV